MMDNRGRVLVFSGPSGSGKSSIINYLLSEIDKAIFSVSTTSRPKRENEIEGIDYNFVSKEEFEKLIQEGKLLEYEENHGNYYGTRKDLVEEALQFGKLVIFDVDTRGRKNLHKYFSDIMISVFITTPSKEILEDRLRKRGTETEEEIQRRLINAVKEMKHLPEYDYFIVNENLESAKKQAMQIAKLVDLKPAKELTTDLIEFWSI